MAGWLVAAGWLAGSWLALASWLETRVRIYIKKRFHSNTERSELHRRTADYDPTSPLPLIARDTVWWMGPRGGKGGGSTHVACVSIVLKLVGLER